MQHRVSRWIAVVWGAAMIAAAAACSSSRSASPAPAARPEAPAGTVYAPPAAKLNPDVVEETAAYYVQRYKKSAMIRVDERHIRSPYMSHPVEIYREDADYFYVRVEKITPEEKKEIVEKREEKAREKTAAERAELEAAGKKSALVVTPEQFDTLVPPRSASGVSFRRAGKGLPERGQWRQNIAVADIDGDGHPDIVAPPPRLTGSLFRVYLGDGRGGFHEQQVTLLNDQGKKLASNFAYGGVAVADFDGDGKPDVALASHGGTVNVFLNRGEGKFQKVSGMPPTFSSQAVAALDVNGDGLPDLAVSRDMVNLELRRKEGKDYHQVRIFVNKGHGRFESADDAILGACFSFNLFPIDLTGTGRRDLLTGCRFLGGWGLTWKNDGKGKFSNELFEIIEQAAYHFAVAPGTFGPDHRVAFADLFRKELPGIQAAGLNVYYKDPAGWHKIAVWRQKGFRERLTSVAMGDLDGDGLDDVVYPDRSSGKVRIFFQTKEGTFQESPESAEPPLDSFVADTRLADIDGDGRLDIVFARTGFSELPKDPGGIEVLLNQGR